MKALPLQLLLVALTLACGGRLRRNDVDLQRAGTDAAALPVTSDAFSLPVGGEAGAASGGLDPDKPGAGVDAAVPDAAVPISVDVAPPPPENQCLTVANSTCGAAATCLGSRCSFGCFNDRNIGCPPCAGLAAAGGSCQWLPPCNASSWFGGDDRPASKPRNAADGVRFKVKSGLRLKQFSFHVRGLPAGSTLVLLVWDASGAALATIESVLPVNRCPGGWVTWDTDLLLRAGQTYAAGAYLKGALQSGIHGSIDSQVDGTLSDVETLRAEIDAGQDERAFHDLATWQVFPNWDLAFALGGLAE